MSPRPPRSTLSSSSAASDVYKRQAYYGAVNTSCALDRCLKKVHDMIDWDNKYPVRDLGNGKVRAVGMGMAMQGSGISGMDVGLSLIHI